MISGFCDSTSVDGVYRIGHEANSEESQDSVIILKSNNPEIIGEQVITGFYNHYIIINYL